jgi:hypothetical protein
MTDNKNFKKLVRERMAKTDEKYTTARQHIESKQRRQSAIAGPGEVALDLVPAAAGQGGTAGNLLVQLLAAPFGVVVGRVPAQAGSADLAVARAQVAELIQNPKFYAKNGNIQTLVARSELDALIAAGAADGSVVQMLRSFRNEHGATFSERCRACNRWIWCGELEREATCVCGQIHRVTFDLADIFHWTMRQGAVCMDCGAAWALSPPAEKRNPWRFASEWQRQCHLCNQKEFGMSEGNEAEPSTNDNEMDRSVLARTRGGVADAHYVVVKFNRDRGETLDDAVEEARKEARERADLLQVGIRRTDQPGHPFVCEWKRTVVDEPWSFRWLAGPDYPAEPPVL